MNASAVTSLLKIADAAATVSPCSVAHAPMSGSIVTIAFWYPAIDDMYSTHSLPV